jgi:RHS repeat-associated protein
LVGKNGGKVWEGEYFAFGGVKVETGSLEQRLRFAGQYYDQETGNYYNYFRDYDPTTGRYLQSDPIGLFGGRNTYAYSRQNPIHFIDPRGLLITGKWVETPKIVDVTASYGVSVSANIATYYLYGIGRISFRIECTEDACGEPETWPMDDGGNRYLSTDVITIPRDLEIAVNPSNLDSVDEQAIDAVKIELEDRLLELGLDPTKICQGRQ